MNLHSRSSLDPRWTRHHIKPVRGFMIAEVRVIRKVAGDVQPVYNQTTMEWEGTNIQTIFTGRARIQPYGIIGDQIVAQDTTGRRLMRVQIENVQTGINLDDMLAVTFCKDDPELTGFTMEVRGTISSSNAWITDLVCEADLKRA